MKNRNSGRKPEREFSDEIVSVCATNAVLQSEGVKSLAPGIAEKYTRTFLRQDQNTAGVKVNHKGDNFVIDVYLIAEFDTKIPEVAWAVQTNVKNRVESMTGYTVAAVNIHVQGVSME